MIPIEHLFMLSGLLIGIGLSAALVRKSMIFILMAVVTLGSGVIIIFSALNENLETSEGFLFAFCVGIVFFLYLILGMALAYRRFLTSHTIDIQKLSQKLSTQAITKDTT